jgi:hypothetical protein
MHVYFYFRLYKPPDSGDATPERPELGLDLLEIGKIEKDVVEKETRDKDHEYTDEIMKPLGTCVKQLGCDITGAFS